MKQRLDREMLSRQLVGSRSQGINYIKLGKVLVNGSVANKPGQLVEQKDQIEVLIEEQYVSRAGLKLASIAKSFKLNFQNKVVLDVGSSTGGFTDYSLRNGARQVIAVDVGTNQLHPSLRTNERVDLHEKTDIRDFDFESVSRPDIVLIDVSFISLRKILPVIKRALNKKIVQNQALVVAMVKPQFETIARNLNKGVVKNNNIRRQILRDFEQWVKRDYEIKQKQDSAVAGEKGNLERFYLLTPKH